MGSLPDAPALVLVAFTLAAVLFLVEVALPTFGVAGLSALALASLGFAAAAEHDQAWWPLLLATAGVCLWAVLLFARRTSVLAQVAAAGLFIVGGASYGALAGDPITVVLSVAGAAALFFSFRPLLARTTRLHDLPPQLGMDALVGRAGVVAKWDGDAGSVQLDGSLWNAKSPSPLVAGDQIVVVGYTGLTIDVALRHHTSTAR
jgi:membrane-bound ClpP family serine protease